MSESLFVQVAREVEKLQAENAELRKKLAEAEAAGGARVALTIDQMAARANVDRTQIYRWIKHHEPLARVVYRLPTLGKQGDLRCNSDEFDAAIKGAKR